MVYINKTFLTASTMFIKLPPIYVVYTFLIGDTLVNFFIPVLFPFSSGTLFQQLEEYRY